MSFEQFYEESPYMTFLSPQIEEWRDGYIRVRLPVREQFINRSGVVHGGVLASMLDNAAGLSGLYCTVPRNKRYGVTVSLTTNFISQAKSGTLIITGQRERSGNRLFFARSQICTEEEALVAQATGVFRYRSGSSDPEGVPARSAEG